DDLSFFIGHWSFVIFSLCSRRLCGECVWGRSVTETACRRGDGTPAGSVLLSTARRMNPEAACPLPAARSRCGPCIERAPGGRCWRKQGRRNAHRNTCPEKFLPGSPLCRAPAHSRESPREET